jgi:hypothetical protein
MRRMVLLHTAMACYFYIRRITFRPNRHSLRVAVGQKPCGYVAESYVVTSENIAYDSSFTLTFVYLQNARMKPINTHVN